jgi:hypothetical protein
MNTEDEILRKYEDIFENVTDKGKVEQWSGNNVQRSVCCHSGADNQVKPITRLSAAEEIQAAR